MTLERMANLSSIDSVHQSRHVFTRIGLQPGGEGRINLAKANFNDLLAGRY